MSKSTLKKHLQTLTKEQIIEQVLNLYDSYKPVKEYLEYNLSPNEKEQFDKNKAIIVNEFYPKGKYSEPKTSFSVAKKGIADFSKLNPSPKLIGDLMVTFAEMACKFTHDYGDLWEQYYTSTVTNYEQALKFLQKHTMLEDFKLRCVTCLKYAASCGYGFPDEMEDVFFKYYPEQ